jgi:hypothetical protein
LKGRGFKPRRTSLSKTYGTARKPFPFKTPRLGGGFPQPLSHAVASGINLRLSR